MDRRGGGGERHKNGWRERGRKETKEYGWKEGGGTKSLKKSSHLRRKEMEAKVGGKDTEEETSKKHGVNAQTKKTIAHKKKRE